MKKIIAIISVIAMMIGLTASVNAAKLTVDSASISGNNITVVDADQDYTGVTFDRLSIYKNGSATAVTGVNNTHAGTLANGSFVIDASGAPANTFDDGEFVIYFEINGSDNGTVSFSVGDTVQVSAVVLPILTMALTNANISFGDLVADTAKAGDLATTITVNTNAASGYAVQVANAGLSDGSNSIADAGNNVDLTSVYGYGINASAVNGDAGSAAASIDSKYVGVDNTNVSGMSTTAGNLVSANGPVASQVTTVNYHTRVSALQEAGNYSDTVTFTITGSF